MAPFNRSHALRLHPSAIKVMLEKGGILFFHDPSCPDCRKLDNPEESSLVRSLAAMAHNDPSGAVPVGAVNVSRHGAAIGSHYGKRVPAIYVVPPNTTEPFEYKGPLDPTSVLEFYREKQLGGRVVPHVMESPLSDLARKELLRAAIRENVTEQRKKYQPVKEVTSEHAIAHNLRTGAPLFVRDEASGTKQKRKMSVTLIGDSVTKPSMRD